MNANSYIQGCLNNELCMFSQMVLISQPPITVHVCNFLCNCCPYPLSFDPKWNSTQMFIFPNIFHLSYHKTQFFWKCNIKIFPIELLLVGVLVMHPK